MEQGIMFQFLTDKCESVRVVGFAQYNKASALPTKLPHCLKLDTCVHEMMGLEPNRPALHE